MVTASRSLNTTPAMICSAAWLGIAPDDSTPSARLLTEDGEVDLDPVLGEQIKHRRDREKRPERQLDPHQADVFPTLFLTLFFGLDGWRCLGRAAARDHERDPAD